MKLMSFVQVVARLHPHLSLSLKGEGIEGRGRSARLHILVAAIVATAAVCLAGYWEFEQVDSGSLGSYVAIDKMSDGTIWLAYVNRDSAIRLAHKDSVWEYEDLDTSLVRPMFPSVYFDDDFPLSFDIGPNAVVGVVGLGRLAERRDTVWSSEELPMPMTGLSLSYDPTGRPSLTFKDSLRRGCLGMRTDSSWDTNVVYVNTIGDRWWFSLSRPSWRRNDNCAFMEADEWSMGGLIDGYDVNLYTRDSEVWTYYTEAIGLDGGGCGFAALPDRSDSIHAFWSAADNYFTNKLVCDAEILDTYTSIGAACLDDSDRVQCAWVIGDVLKYALAHEPTIEVGSGSIEWCDITTDALSQPVIAYCTSDGSIYVAHGVDVAGLGGEPRGWAVHARQSKATIVRGVLFLTKISSRKPQATSLLDISGQKVMDLHPGAIDISRLAPGVYFMVTLSPTSSPPEGERVGVRGRVGSATKIVIAR